MKEVHLATRRQLFATISACLMVVACGTSSGWVSPTLMKLCTKDSEIPMSPEGASWMVSVLEVGNLLSPIPAGLLADSFGRKRLALSTGLLFIVSWLIIIKMKTLAALCIGRTIQGVAKGVMFTVMPLYMGEIASPNIRGAITSLFQISYYLGFQYEYVIGPFVSFDVLNLISIIVPILFLGLFFWQPESPYYYIMNSNHDQAEKTLMWLRGTSNFEEIKDEFEDITQSVQEQMKNKASLGDIVATPAVKRALLIVQIVGTVRSASGLLALISYSTELFESTGFTLIPPDVMTIIVGSVLFASGFFSTFLTDRTGRRPLLLISTIGSAFSLGFVSLFFYLYERTDYDLSEYTWVCPVCVVLYFLFFAFGLDPVSMSYRSEMFPANTRAITAGLNSVSFTISTFIALKLYETVVERIGVYFIFMMYSSTCFLGSIWMYFYAIETNNKSLSQIQRELNMVTQC